MAWTRKDALTLALKEAPSSAVWLQLKTLLDSWPVDDGLDAAIEACLEALASWPDALRIGNGWWPGGGDNPRWVLARKLSLGYGELTLENLAEIVKAPAFARVRCLDMPRRAKGPELVARLAEVGGLGEIRALNFSSREIGPEGARLLAGMDLPKLESLDLSGCALEGAGVEALLAAPWMAGVQVLNLSRSLVGAAGAAALASAGLESLRSLNLEKTPEFGDEALVALSAGAFTALESLQIADCTWGKEGIAALAAAQWGALRSLDISFQRERFGDEGAAAMAAAWNHPTLESLKMWTNEVKTRGSVALAGCAGLASLRDLDYTGNAPGLEGIKAMAASEHLRAVEVLNLNHCGLGAEGVEALAGSALLDGLKSLMIPRNSCTARALRVMLTGGGLQALKHLDLAGNKMGVDGAQSLAAAMLYIPAIESLQLESTGMTAAGVEGMGAAGLRPRELDLRDNPITSLRALGASGLASRLRSLDASKCGLGDAEVDGMTRYAFPELETLKLRGKSLSAKGLEALVANQVHLPALRHFEYLAGLFTKPKPEELDALAQSTHIAWAALCGGLRVLKKRIPEFAPPPVEEAASEAPAPAVDTRPSPLESLRVYERPSAGGVIEPEKVAALTEVDAVNMGALHGFRWTSETHALVWTATGVWRYDVRDASRTLVLAFGSNKSCLSSDGRFMTGQRLSTSVYWVDLEEGSHRAIPVEPKEHFAALSISPDNETVVMVGSTDLVMMKVSDGTMSRQPLGFGSGSGTVLVWSGDGEHFALGYNGNHVVYDRNGVCRKKWYFGKVDTLSFTPDGKSLLSAAASTNIIRSGAKYLRQWSLDGELEHEIATPNTGPSSNLNAIAFSPEGGSVVVGGRDQTLHVFDPATWKRERVVESKALDVFERAFAGRSALTIKALSFSPTGQQLMVVTEREPTCLQVWDVATWTRTHFDFGFAGETGAVSFSSDGSVLGVATNEDARIYVDGRPGPVPLFDWKAPYKTADIDIFELFPDGKKALLGCGTIHTNFTYGVLDLETQALDFSFSCKQGPQAAAISRDGQLVVTSHEKGELRLWKMGRKTALKVLKGHTKRAAHMCFSPDGTGLVTQSSRDKSLRIWTVDGKNSALAHTATVSGERGSYRSAAISQTWVAGGASRMVQGVRQGEVHLWERGDLTMKTLTSIEGDSFTALAFSPDQRLLAAALSGGSIQLVSVESGEVLREIDAHGVEGQISSVGGLAFSQDGQEIVSFSRRGSVKRWALR